MYVKAKRTFKKSKHELLTVIRKPGNLEYFHPFCIENKVEKWPGEGSIDYVKYLNGLKYRRDFVKWDESGYVLDIGVKSKLARVEWLVEGNSRQSSLTIKINPKLPYKNQILSWILWNIYIKFRLQSYINNVVKGFEDYLSTKRKVSMNKFGKHPWYS